MRFLVIPVEPGIFSILRQKCRFSTANQKRNQSLTGQFPLPAKREFFAA